MKFSISTKLFNFENDNYLLINYNFIQNGAKNLLYSPYTANENIFSLPFPSGEVSKNESFNIGILKNGLINHLVLLLLLKSEKINDYYNNSMKIQLLYFNNLLQMYLDGYSNLENNFMFQKVDILGTKVNVCSRSNLLKKAESVLRQNKNSYHFLSVNPIKVIRAQNDSEAQGLY